MPVDEYMADRRRRATLATLVGSLWVVLIGPVSRAAALPASVPEQVFLVGAIATLLVFIILPDSFYVDRKTVNLKPVVTAPAKP